MVVGEDQQPIKDANVSLGFGDTSSQGTTDVNGLFTGEGHCRGDYGASITKQGFYLSGVGSPQLTNIVDGKWLPWNPTVMSVLRPIGKPVALYAKSVHKQIPALNEPCGYDLEAGDWVTPYGKGMKKDFIFTIHQDWRGISDYDVQGEMTFKNPLDGLQETSVPDIGKNSEFKWERQTPENGYVAKQELRNAWFPDGSGQKPVRSFKSPDDWDGYFFRVRTVEQDGKIVSAHYGKIRGGIYVYPDNKSGKPKIVFMYYFNATPNDRNLEWDTKKNLFGNLPFMETPREP